MSVLAFAASCGSGSSTEAGAPSGVPTIDAGKVDGFLSVTVPEGQALGRETPFCFSITAIKETADQAPVMRVDGMLGRKKATYLLGAMPPRPMAAGASRTFQCPFPTTKGMRLVIDLVPMEDAGDLRPID